MIFVFGSNEGGVHGGGAALVAYLDHGAVYGKSYGHYGNSFAIPTMGRDFMTLPLPKIAQYVGGFLAYAHGLPSVGFKVTALGTGIAGLDHKVIAGMFKTATPNCYFDEVWKPHLGDDFNYWGSY